MFDFLLIGSRVLILLVEMVCVILIVI